MQYQLTYLPEGNDKTGWNDVSSSNMSCLHILELMLNP